MQESISRAATSENMNTNRDSHRYFIAKLKLLMTTKLKKTVFLLYAFFYGTILVQAQDVEINVSAPKVVAVNEPFQLVYTINKQASGFQQPDLSEFLYSGPSRGTQFSQTYVNGKMQSTQQSSYTYVVQIQKAGKFTISPAKFVVDGKTHPTRSVKIEVVKGNAPNTNNNTKKKSAAQVGDKDLFVKVMLNKSSVYKDEPLVATIKIYTRASISGFEDMKLPSFTGFWSQEIQTPKHIDLQRENVGGVIYQVGLIRKNLLFPQRTGKIKIDPVELDVAVRYRTRPNSFWDDGVRQMTKKVKSKAITVNVKPLPKPEPVGFTGAVGSFKLKTSLDKNKLKTNDALTLKVTISGSGNLRLIKAPKINFPPDFDVYDPKEQQNIKVGASGAQGSKTFEYVLIPRHRGSFSIPEIKIPYFDLKTKSYKSLSSSAMPVEVEKGEGDETVVATTTVRSGADRVKVIQRDIRYIKTENIDLAAKGNTIFNSIFHWLFFIIVGAAFGIFVAFKQKQIKENKNISLMRNKRASKVSQKRLKQARTHMEANEKEQFFEEVLRATWGYLSDKLSIDVAELNKDNIRTELVNRNIDNGLVERLGKLIDTCEYARYAPVRDAEIGNTFDEASEVINTLDQNL